VRELLELPSTKPAISVMKVVSATGVIVAGAAIMLNFPKDVFNNEGNLRTILDVGCGVASFGGYLLSSDVITIIDWLQRDGILLLELDRLLRPGGYFAYSSPEAYAQDEEDLRIWKEMSTLVERMCWKIAAKQNETIVWVKPLTNDCYLERAPDTQPPLCRLFLTFGWLLVLLQVLAELSPSLSSTSSQCLVAP
ncbi:probable methyltransferase PMT3, partial [Tanacetum coccineum]